MLLFKLYVVLSIAVQCTHSEGLIWLTVTFNLYLLPLLVTAAHVLEGTSNNVTYNDLILYINFQSKCHSPARYR
jgi:hypothetical protein